MKFPKAAAGAVKRFSELTPTAPNVIVKQVFGYPAAFVNGNMFFGVFGDEIFVRLTEADRVKAADVAGAVPFEPMKGRPMREYMVLPERLLAGGKRAKEWVARSLQYASTLPPKPGKGT